MLVVFKDGSEGTCDADPKSFWLLHQAIELANGTMEIPPYLFRLDGIPVSLPFTDVDVDETLKRVILKNFDEDDRDTIPDSGDDDVPIARHDTMPCLYG